MSDKQQRTLTRQQIGRQRRPTPTLRLVLVEVGRSPWMTAATWEITPDVDVFVGDYNKAVVYARERAKKDRASWDAENDRIIRKGTSRCF